MKIVKCWPALGLILSLAAFPAESQAPLQPSSLTYADHADLALTAPVAAHVRIARADRLRPKDAVGVPAGKTRFYVEADVVSLIRGAQGLPQRVTYLVDLPNAPDGKPPRLRKKEEYILFAATVPGRVGELRLAAPDAHLPWTAARAEEVRAILTAANRADAPPTIIGAGRAFNVPGSLPGESETQIFLQTQEGEPVSLSILRRPGEQPRWAVALGEIVDEAAEPPQPNTLLWYRLACGLPRSLPPQSLSEADAAASAAIQSDYQLVLEALGPCARRRAAR